ncbi:heme exporter protein D [Nitrosomonas eutropha]|uniref:Heme exporter protein D n=2 Tax=Nitrosomonas eutropha TaxID=916 RepID=A0ABX5MA38_9PROT|nr:heme exporter protein D [Nitrosomonas eutropha]
MNWTSPAEFFAMGGYGQYVWGSFGVALVVLCAEWLLLRQRRQAALSQVKRQLILREEESR